MARPTIYSDDIPDRVREYVKAPDIAGDVLPTVEGLAVHLGVCVKTLQNWAKQEDKAEFLRSLNELKAVQKKTLVQQGLIGEYNPTIAKLVLSHNHGMIERSAKEISGPEGNPIEVTEVRRTIVDP